MFSQSEFIFRIEIKYAIFKRIITKRPFVSHIFKTQTNVFRIFGRSCHPLKFLPENRPCLQFASKSASVTLMQLQGGKPIGLWLSTQINVQYSPSLKRKHPSNMTIYFTITFSNQ